MLAADHSLSKSVEPVCVLMYVRTSKFGHWLGYCHHVDGVVVRICAAFACLLSGSNDMSFLFSLRIVCSFRSKSVCISLTNVRCEPLVPLMVVAVGLIHYVIPAAGRAPFVRVCVIAFWMLKFHDYFALLGFANAAGEFGSATELKTPRITTATSVSVSVSPFYVTLLGFFLSEICRV